MNFADSLSRMPVGNSVEESKHEEEYAANCIVELTEFNKRNGSIIEESMKLDPIDQSRNELINRIKKNKTIHSFVQQTDYIIDSENSTDAHKQTREQGESEKSQ